MMLAVQTQDENLYVPDLEVLVSHRFIPPAFVSSWSMVRSLIDPVLRRAGHGVLGVDHPQVATALHGLANLYCAQGDFEKTDETLAMACRITERALGSDHPKTLEYKAEHGAYLIGHGPDRSRQGLDLLRKASVGAQALDPEDPIRARILHFARKGEMLAKNLGLD